MAQRSVFRPPSASLDTVQVARVRHGPRQSQQRARPAGQ